LGTVTTVEVAVSNLGQPAASVQVYEALATPALPPALPSGGALRVALPAQPGPITPELLNAFASAPNVPRDMIVYLSDQADLSAAAAIPNWNERGAAVVAA